MDRLSRRTNKTADKKAHSRRSRSLTPPPGSPGKRSTRSRRSRKSSSRYTKLRDKDEDEIEMMDLNNMAALGAFAQAEIGKGG